MKVQDLPGFMPCPKPPKNKKADKAQSAKRAKFLEELAEYLEAKEVYGCEVCYWEHSLGLRSAPQKGCNVLDPGHRHEREDYYSQPEKLWTINQVILVGRAHHNGPNGIDRDKAFREKVFQALRGDDLLAMSE